MSMNVKRLLALLLALCATVSLMAPVVSADGNASNETTEEEEYVFPDFGELVDLGEALKGRAVVYQYVEKYLYEDQEYIVSPTKGGGFYVFKLTEYLNNAQTGGTWIYDSKDSGIENPRGMVVSSKGIIYVVGDRAHIFAYDFAKKTSWEIPIPTTKEFLTSIAIDENDNLYICLTQESTSDPGRVIKVTPDEEVSDFYLTDETSRAATCSYGDGYLYVFGAKRGAMGGIIHKVDVKTGKQVGKAADLPQTTAAYYMTYIDGVLFLGHGAVMADGMVAVDVDTMDRIDVGVTKYVKGVVTAPTEEGKCYMNLYGTGLHEYDIHTRKATPVKGLASFDSALRIKNNAFVKDDPTKLVTQFGDGAEVFILDIKNGTYEEIEDIVEEANSPAFLRSVTPGVPGDDVAIYFGGYLSPYVGSYSPNIKETDTVKRLESRVFNNGHAQTDRMITYKGKIYCGVYNGAYLVEYDPKTGTVSELINTLNDDYKQIRIHELKAGDNKIFFGTVADTYAYDCHVGWYDLTTGEVTIIQTPVPNQMIHSLIYDEEENLLYGASTTYTAATTTPIAKEAMMVVIDVDQAKVLGTFSTNGHTNPNSDIYFNEDKGDILPHYIAGIAQDPDSGKNWGMVYKNLFTFEYNRAKNTLTIHEEWRIGDEPKNTYPLSATINMFGRPLVFDGNGHLIVWIHHSNVHIFDLSDMSKKPQTIHKELFFCSMGNDGDFYGTAGYNLFWLPMTHKSIVKGMILGTDPSQTEKIVEARKAYNALTDEEKASFNEDDYEALLALEGASVIYQASAVSNTENLIVKAGAITANSEADLVRARQAYESLSAENKAKVSNYAALQKAEEEFARITALTRYQEDTKVDINFSQKVNPLTQGVALTNVTYDHVTGGTWAFADTNIEAGALFNAGKQMNILFSSVQKYWYALKVKIPQAGVYNISVQHTEMANGAIGNLMMFPGNMYLTQPDLKTPAPANDEIMLYRTGTGHSVGTIDFKTTGVTDLKDWVCDAPGEYYLVFNGDGCDGRALVDRIVFTKQNARFDTMVEAVKEKIDAIGKVTLKSEKKIADARLAYNSLTNSQKQLIYAPMLEAAEAEFKILKQNYTEQMKVNNAAVAAVKIQIDVIGKVSLGSKSAIDAARAAYDALTAEQKKMVPNIETLEAAEAEYAKLLEQSGEKGSPVVTIVIVVAVVLVLAGAGVGAYFIIKKKKAQQPAQDEEATQEVAE